MKKRMRKAAGTGIMAVVIIYVMLALGVMAHIYQTGQENMKLGEQRMQEQMEEYERTKAYVQQYQVEWEKKNAEIEANGERLRKYVESQQPY